MKTSRKLAFTLIEMLVVISIIAILAAFAVPALTSALTKGQMTGTMNNARQFYLAGQQMALDGTANGDPSLGWPADITSPAAIASLKAYCDKLVQNKYLSAGDLQKIFSAPSVNCVVTGGTFDSSGNYTAISAMAPVALKVYKVSDVNPGNTIFVESANYTYNTALTPASAPYGDKGFIVQRKAGDASVFRQAQSKAGTSGAAFQQLVGRVPGDADGTVGNEAGSILP